MLDRFATGPTVLVARRLLTPCLTLGVAANLAQHAAQFGYRLPGGWLYYHTSDFIHGLVLSLCFFASMVFRWAATIFVAALFMYSFAMLHFVGGNDDVRTFVVDRVYFL